MAQYRNYTHTTPASVGDNLARVQAPAREGQIVTRKQNQVLRNRERSRSMSLGFVLGLLLVVGAALSVCIGYLSVQNSINARLHNIAQLEDQLETLQKKNEALELSINTCEDYAHIYQVATTELGMVPAGADQIVWFEMNEGEYVKQNEAIPGR